MTIPKKPTALMLRNSRQRGYGLIDILLGVAVSAVLILGAYTVYRALTGDVKSNDQGRATVALLGEINRLYGQAQSYSALSTTTAVRDGIVPKSFKTPTATTIQHAWGGALTIGPGNQAGATPTSQFKLTFTGVDQSECLHFVTALAGNAASLWVGGTTAGTHDVVDASTRTFDPTKAGTQCAAATAATNIILVSN